MTYYYSFKSPNALIQSLSNFLMAASTAGSEINNSVTSVGIVIDLQPANKQSNTCRGVLKLAASVVAQT